VERCGKYTAANFAGFLQIVLVSTNETDYLLFLAKDLPYLSEEKYEELDKQVNKIKAMLINVLNKVRKTG
jgi:four helix bundle protein